MTCITPLDYSAVPTRRFITSLRITYAVAMLAGGSVMLFGMGAGLFVIPAAIVIGSAAVLSATRLAILHALGANVAAAMCVGFSVFLTQLHNDRSAGHAYGEAAYIAMSMIGMFGVLGLFGGGVTIAIRAVVRRVKANRVRATTNAA